MNANNYCKIMLLAAMLALGGCAGNAAQPMLATNTGAPILSAEQARSMISVTVSALPPGETPDTLVAVSADAPR